MIKKLFAALLLFSSPAFAQGQIFYDWSVCQAPIPPSGPYCPGISAEKLAECKANYIVLATTLRLAACIEMENVRKVYRVAINKAIDDTNKCVKDNPSNPDPCYDAFFATKIFLVGSSQAAVDAITNYLMVAESGLLSVFWACIEKGCDGEDPGPEPGPGPTPIPLTVGPTLLDLSLYGVSPVVQTQITPFFVVPLDNDTRYATIATACPCKS